MNLFCNLCNMYVSEQTKHCKSCDRCCEGFDHHCEWLNYCVGIANYEIFIKLIHVYLVLNLSTICLFVYNFAKSLVTEEKTGTVAIVVLLWIQAVINLIAFFVDLDLIYLHRWLIKHGLSTYEYTIY